MINENATTQNAVEINEALEAANKLMAQARAELRKAIKGMKEEQNTDVHAIEDAKGALTLAYHVTITAENTWWGYAQARKVAQK